MNNDSIVTLVIIIVGFIIVFFVGRSFFRLIGKSSSGKSRKQREIDQYAFSQANDDERWHEIGKFIVRVG